MTELAERKLRQARRALEILEAKGYASRLAGGCVRDRLLRIDPVDYDVATVATPAETMQVFAEAGFKTVPTGLMHGTVTLVMPAGPIEVTTLRRDIETDGRHAVVAFSSAFEEDAARRDFTVNAMFEDKTGQIYDFFHGQRDLADSTLRFVGDARVRIKEDYLRILRFFRFSARFTFRPAPGTLEAIGQEKEGLKKLSQERVTSELLKTLAAPGARASLEAMQRHAVWEVVLPELSPCQLPALSVFSVWQTAEDPDLAVLGGLILTKGMSVAETKNLVKRLKLSALQKATLVSCPTLRATLLGKQLAKDIAQALDFVDALEQVRGDGALQKFYAPVFSVFQELRPSLEDIIRAEQSYGHKRKSFPLKGNDVQAALPNLIGKALGAALTQARRAYRNGEWLDKDQGLDWIKDTIARQKD